MKYHRAAIIGLALVGLLGSGCGPLGTPFAPVGRACRTNADCRTSELCLKKWGECEGMGKCETIPASWGANLDIVCGCDGHTYGSRWIASKHDIAVAHSGKCPGEPWPSGRQ
jgi:hypothetical protein